MMNCDHCKVRRTSSPSKIKSILKGNSVVIQSTHGILIGSRAARHYLPNFRGIRHDQNADWNILCSSEFFLAWWDERDERIEDMEMVIPKLKDGSKLDLHIDCLMRDGSKYKYIIPRLSLTYTAYLLENSEDWTEKRFPWTKLIRKGNCIVHASTKLLLIMKRYMLYYTHEWRRTAEDYRELLTITDPVTEEDGVLCDLFVHYNEKMYGKRQCDTRKNSSMEREDFFQRNKSERIESVYQMAMSMSTTGDILIGMEYLCTQAPLWLADYVIDNWISIQNEKFKQKFPLFRPGIKFDIDDHSLFPQLPKNVTQRILHHITDIIDFHSMQFVCKQWYTLFQEESFWRDLYISRYGMYSMTTSWKMLYLTKIAGQLMDNKFEELVDASIDIRRLTGNDVLQLWEDLTHREQRVDPGILSRIDYILSNAFYYGMTETSDEYSVKLVINELTDDCSLSKVQLSVHTSEYKTLQFTDHTEDLLIEYQCNDKAGYSAKFLGPNLVGFDLDCLGYIAAESTLHTSTSNLTFPAFPMGLLICLFILIVHPKHRMQFIHYLKSLESRCLTSLSD